MDLFGRIFQREGQDTNINYTLITIPADYDFIDTFQIEMLEGRCFAKENATDNTAIILNEATVRNLGLEDPIGKHSFPGSLPMFYSSMSTLTGCTVPR
jgi:hypothetical protein